MNWRQSGSLLVVLFFALLLSAPALADEAEATTAEPAPEETSSQEPEAEAETPPAQERQVRERPAAEPAQQRAAQPPARIEVVDAKTAASVEDREAVGAASEFNPGDNVVFWMSLRNPGQPQTVNVVWSAGGAEVHTFEVNVGQSARWRTWAQTRVNRPGPWTVEVRDQQGNKLQEVSFTVSGGS
jgi:hypothetical protein